MKRCLLLKRFGLFKKMRIVSKTWKKIPFTSMGSWLLKSLREEACTRYQSYSGFNLNIQSCNFHQPFSRNCSLFCKRSFYNDAVEPFSKGLFLSSYYLWRGDVTNKYKQPNWNHVHHKPTQIDPNMLY